MSSVENEIEILLEARRAYYRDGSSTMTDKEYDDRHDKLVAELPDNHWFSRLVGNLDDKSPWNKESHLVPLGSLSKVQIESEYNDWHNKLLHKVLIIQEKLDGISIDLVYEHGKLTKAITRGNGIVGEDIFRNVVKMKHVPLSINTDYEIVNIRGEILLQHSVFDTLDGLYKNPRNAASGIAKSLDGTNCEYLSVISYDVLNMEECNLFFETEAIKFLEDNGFKPVEYAKLIGFDEVVKYYTEYVNSKRQSLDWDIDGLVIKTNHYENPGENWGHPKNKIAWKFPHQRGETKLIGIEASARGGRITPVALLEPIDLCGVTIQRASLANWDNVLKMKIGAGAIVEVSRRNDVIPYIESVLIPGDKPQIPTECPVCKGDVEFEKNTSGVQLAYLICTNDNCSSKLSKQITRWLASHETKGIGGAFVEQMVDGGHVSSLIDFLNIPYNQYFQDILLQMDKMGRTKLKTINTQIENSCRTTVAKLLYGLDIKNLGHRTTDVILDAMSNHYDNITVNNFIEFVNSKNIIGIDKLGEETIESIKNGINKKSNIIDRLLNIVTIEDLSAPSQLSDMFKDKIFCFTGKLYTITRNDAQKFVKSNGGSIGSANKKLSYLVTNFPDSSTGKAKAVRKLNESDDINIKIISETDFLEMIGLDDKIEEVEKISQVDQVKKTKSTTKKIQPELNLDIDSDINEL